VFLLKQAKSQQTKPVRTSFKKEILIISGSVLIIFAILWAVITVATAYSLMNPVRKPLYTLPDELGLDNYEYIEVPGPKKGDNMIGWWIPAQEYKGEIINSDKTVIFSHNYGSNREMIEISGLYFARYLVESGYNVVMFDYAGSGSSEGSKYTMGHEEKDELLSVIKYIKETKKQNKIALHGWAYGAAAAILAGAESDDVTAIIADSSYKDLKAYLQNNLQMWTKLPDFLFSPAIRALLPLMSGTDLWDTSPINVIKSMSNKNIFFIHGTSDTVFPYSDSQDMYQEAIKNNTADIWIVQNSRHIYAFKDQEENYDNKVLEFLNKSMT
jgi:fermentation-respiration switch protein FrsA (DUF1100 family)